MTKTPNVMGFSGSVNGTTKNPGFLDFGFCQCKWAYRGKSNQHSFNYTDPIIALIGESCYFGAYQNKCYHLEVLGTFGLGVGLGLGLV